MSNMFAHPNQRGPVPPQGQQIHQLLVENNYLIQSIVDMQNKGRPQESTEYLRILHRNLAYLIQKCNLNIQISDVNGRDQQELVMGAYQHQMASQLGMNEEAPPNVTAPFDPIPIASSVPHSTPINSQAHHHEGPMSRPQNETQTAPEQNVNEAFTEDNNFEQQDASGDMEYEENPDEEDVDERAGSESEDPEYEQEHTSNHDSFSFSKK